ncbi:hypothetical protein EJB05_02909, partial [Eragrostis curvula]
MEPNPRRKDLIPVTRPPYLWSTVPSIPRWWRFKHFIWEIFPSKIKGQRSLRFVESNRND